MPLQHYINHISLIVDRSGSMQRHSKSVVDVFDRELNNLKKRSVELDQETRISIYLFDTTIECLTFDMDVMRFKSLAGYYKIGDSTALLDAVAKSVEDNRKLPELYGDHAFLQYVITDGQENASHKTNAAELSYLLKHLPDNWTNAVLVPDASGEKYAEKFGFNKGSIAIWDTSKVDALDKIGTQFTHTLDNYMSMRSKGVRGTTSLFTLDTSNLSATTLKELPANKYQVIPVTRDGYIREYVLSVIKTYDIGSAYFQPTKKVVIQDYKNLLVQSVKDGKVYEGKNLRQLLGLPSDTAEVDPGQHANWNIFVQSTSVNRKLFSGTNVLMLR